MLVDCFFWQHVMRTTRTVFGKHKQGYVFPMLLSVNPMETSFAGACVDGVSDVCRRETDACEHSVVPKLAGCLRVMLSNILRAGVMQELETSENFILFTSKTFMVTAATRTSMALMGVRDYVPTR